MRFEATRAAVTIVPGTMLVAAILFPGTALADYSASAVAIPLAGGLDKETATIGYALESVVRQNPRVEFVDLAGKADGEAVLERRQTREQARALFERGVRAYENFEYSEALHALEDAVAAFEQTDLTQTFPELLEAYAMKAATSYFNGDVDVARRTIGRLLSFRTNYVFDGRMFPPDVRDVADDIRAEVEEESRNPLEIIVDGTHARVYVNGVFRGISPMEVRNLPPASHHVTLVSLGNAMLQDRHRAGPGALMRVSMMPAADGATVAGLLSSLERRMKQGEVSEPGAGIARWADVDEVLVAGVNRAGGGRLRAVMARVASDGHVLAVGEHDLLLEDPGALSELAAGVSELYREDLPRGPGGEPVPRALRLSPVFTRATLGYVVGGTGVAAGIGGVVMGLRAQRQATAAKEIPQRRQEEIQEAISGARRSALLADILYGTALVGTIAGAYLAMPALRPEPAEPSGRGMRDDWFSVVPVPIDGIGGPVRCSAGSAGLPALAGRHRSSPPRAPADSPGFVLQAQLVLDGALLTVGGRF